MLTDLEAALIGVIAGSERRGVTRREAQLLTFLVAYGSSSVAEWEFRPSKEGPESKLVDETLERLYDRGVVTLRFERSRNEPVYVVTEPEKIPGVTLSREYQIGYITSHSLLIEARLDELELKALVALLAPEQFTSGWRPDERLVARLVAKNALKPETASRLSGIPRERIERLASSIRSEYIELLITTEHERT